MSFNYAYSYKEVYLKLVPFPRKKSLLSHKDKSDNATTINLIINRQNLIINDILFCDYMGENFNNLKAH